MRCSLQSISRLGAGLVLTFPSLAVAAPYSITDIGVLPGGSLSVANAISDNGVVAGESTANGELFYTIAVAWVDGRLIELTGVAVSGAKAFGVNDDGIVVGASDEGVFHAFQWTGGLPSPLATFIDNVPSAVARDINESGIIVGSSFNIAVGSVVAVTWSDGVIAALPGTATSTAMAINSRGLIVGAASADGSGGLDHAALWDDAGSHDLGTLDGDTHSIAYDINDRNEIVGFSSVVGFPFTVRAFIWRGGTMSDLGTLGGNSTVANAINNSSIIVGGSYIASPVGTSIQHAFQWIDGRMIDLNHLIDPSSGWTLSEALDINEHGQIVGRGVRDGLTRGFILTPNDPADVDGDGDVDSFDLALLLGAWGGCAAACPADVDGNGIVNGLDLAMLLADWRGS